MRYDDEYLKIKKIVAIEEIAKMILNNKECWDADLESLVNIRATEILDKIGKVLAMGKTDEQTVAEVRKILKEHNISDENI